MPCHAIQIMHITTTMLFTQSFRPTCRQCAKQLQSSQPVRHATLLKRPKRPYQFTQLITLSDGSTFTHRTTSPAPIYKSTKDTKNHAMWNPSSQKLLNVEEDEAGRLRKFRAKFGRGYDAETMSGEKEAEGRDGDDALSPHEEEQGMLDMISTFGQKAEKKGKAKGSTQPAKKSGKGKGGEK
ncbi:hypothetical protein AC578_8138 [Pseudocercospora eumusae]|uniref:Ribosomal protein bL31m N-terminal domain-containing protein n=1 Tax=Pseudocercospora eumusae TaxID=321146 RepID=A0A139HAC9_9PEZI|nr:hypothetical protein AC578_8138 [Pseudocercospora eumusae]